jgi:hypothetical protein
VTQSRSGDPARPPTSVHRLEISGDFDRATAEALMLEIQRIGKRCGVELNSTVERVVPTGEARSM